MPTRDKAAKLEYVSVKSFAPTIETATPISLPQVQL